jgi:hypothetical protein
LPTIASRPDAPGGRAWSGNQLTPAVRTGACQVLLREGATVPAHCELIYAVKATYPVTMMCSPAADAPIDLLRLGRARASGPMEIFDEFLEGPGGASELQSGRPIAEIARELSPDPKAPQRASEGLDSP